MSAGTTQQNAYGAGDLSNAYASYLPTITGAQNSALTPSALAQLTAAQSSTPGSNLLDLQQQQQFALPTAQVNQNIAASNAQAGANSNLSLLNGTGAQIAQAGLGINQATNPNYYTAQNAASNGAAAGVNAINLNGLSPGEAAATERSLNQNNVGSGNLGLLNPTNTISNAMNFGGAFNSKLGLMNSAVGAASGAANSAAGNGGFNGVNTALGTSQMATGNPFSSDTSALGSANTTNNSLGSNLLSNLGTITNTNLGNNFKINTADSAQGIAQGFGGGNSIGSGGLGASCCFVCLEGINGPLPKFVREMRESYYNADPRIQIGYITIAAILVPTMMSSKLFRRFINRIMVTPMIRYGGYITESKGYARGWIYKLHSMFWLNTFKVIGGIYGR